MVNTDDFSGNTALYKSIADCCRESVIIFDNYGDIKYANSVAIEETGYANQSFFRKQFNVLCFVNKELKSVAIFGDSLDLRKMHYLQFLLHRIL